MVLRAPSFTIKNFYSGNMQINAYLTTALVSWYVPFAARVPSLMFGKFSICFNFPLIYEEAGVACGVYTNVALPKRKLKFTEVWLPALTKRADQAVNFECNTF